VTGAAWGDPTCAEVKREKLSLEVKYSRYMGLKRSTGTISRHSREEGTVVEEKDPPKGGQKCLNMLLTEGASTGGA